MKHQQNLKEYLKIYIYIYISPGRRKEEVIDENQSFIIIYIYIHSMNGVSRSYKFG